MAISLTIEELIKRCSYSNNSKFAKRSKTLVMEKVCKRHKEIGRYSVVRLQLSAIDN